MGTFAIFFISTIPAGIALLLFFRNREKVDSLMRREHPRYSGGINNSIDVFRILIVVSKSNKINNEEKKTLVYALLNTFISWITIIIWIVIFIFFPESILN